MGICLLFALSHGKASTVLFGAVSNIRGLGGFVGTSLDVQETFPRMFCSLSCRTDESEEYSYSSAFSNILLMR